jgi:hypothetical protein
MAENQRTASRSPYQAGRIKVFPTAMPDRVTNVGDGVVPVGRVVDPTDTQLSDFRRGSADRSERYTNIGYYGADISAMNPAQRTAYLQSRGIDTTPAQNVNIDIAGALGLGGGGSGGSGLSASDKLALQKWQYEKAQDAEEKAKQQRAYALMKQQLEDGSYRGDVDAALARIKAMDAASKGGIESIYGNVLGNINAGYNVASGMSADAYKALTDYLSANPNNAFAGLTQQVTAPQDQMAQMLGAYGVSAPEVAAQMQAEQLAGQQGAGAFNTLADFLASASRQADLSRLAEARAAGAFAGTQLGQERAAYQSQAARSRQDALTALAERTAQAQFDQEQAAEAARQAIINALIAAGVDPNSPKTPAAPSVTLPLNKDEVAAFQRQRLGLDF